MRLLTLETEDLWGVGELDDMLLARILREEMISGLSCAERRLEQK